MTRETFQHQGIVDWRRLPLGVLLHLGPILIVGAILAALQWTGYYVVILVPIFVAIIPALLSAGLAGWVKWREPRFAGSVGFVLGALAYVSQFYVMLIYFNGLAFWWRIDLVPLVMIEFMQHLQIGDEEINVGKNWMIAVVETCTVGGAFALAHVQVTQRLYCPLCNAALKMKSSILPPDFATALATGIAKNCLDDLPLDESGGEIEGDAWSAVEVLYCFHAGADAEPLFYLTLRETRFAQGAGVYFVILDKIRLSADEMLAIGEKCPGLALSSSPPSDTSQSPGDQDSSTQATENEETAT